MTHIEDGILAVNDVSTTASQALQTATNAAFEASVANQAISRMENNSTAGAKAWT